MLRAFQGCLEGCLGRGICQFEVEIVVGQDANLPHVSKLLGGVNAVLLDA